MFKPNLAGKYDAATQVYPCIGSPKIDGYRCLAMDGVPRTRSMKVVGNRFVQEYFAQHANAMQGYDGELVVGSPSDPNVFNLTTGAMRREEGEPDFTYWVFDLWDRDQTGYSDRFKSLLDAIETYGPERVRSIPCRWLYNRADLENYQNKMLLLGYEGIMLRDPNGIYKQGRSSTKEGGILKVKLYVDAEAKIIDMEEEMFNGNEARTNELGRTVRSTHQEKLVGKNSMGALVCSIITGPFEGKEVNIGTGFTAEQRKEMWKNRENYWSEIVKFKYFEPGSIDKPRHPVFLGVRCSNDMDVAAE